jgi:hypothetical protein
VVTLYDLGVEIIKIREAINQIQVSGQENASLIVYAHKKCNELIETINAIASQNGEEGEVENESD